MKQSTDPPLTDKRSGEKEGGDRILGQDIVSQARSKLDRHTCLHNRSESISIDFIEGRLVLMGRLPSFYLKQLLQTSLQGLPGVQRIENRVNVVSTTGLSSTKHVSQ